MQRHRSTGHRPHPGVASRGRNCCAACWIDESTAPGTARVTASFRITHLFQPLAGRQIDLICIRSIFGRRHVYFHRDDGHLWAVPLAWTDLAPPDSFPEIALGQSLFRPDDPLRLASVIEHLGGPTVGEAGSRGEGHV